YIYYKDKDDLIVQIAREEFLKMSDSVMKDFDTASSFEAGLRYQWKKRSAYLLATPYSMLFFDQLKSSSYQLKIYESSISGFREGMEKFIKKAIINDEISALPLEVFWSIAFAPLYTLIRFHHDGKSLGGKPFQLSNEVMEHTLTLVLKALKK
ncbi:MAG: TetR/AcrR family transcriptional regulator, partial [Chitinophagaceae bacterium]|nr:TetR/AcrR family transcriptional regulator [Chitinophagaceae bacterium]